MKIIDSNVIFCALAAYTLLIFSPVSNCIALPAAASADSSAASNVDVGEESYPRVNELEQQLLGKTYLSEPLAQRLTRLEMKAFGKASPGADLCDRVDKLDRFAPSTAKPSYETDAETSDGSTADTTNGATSSTASAQTGGGKYVPSDYGNYPRVTALEEKLLKQSYTSDPLPVRVARLETKEFGKTTPNDDLCDRLDRLDKAVDPHGNNLATDNPNSSDANSSDPNTARHRGFGGSLGRSLLNMVGGGMLGVGGAGPGVYNPSGIGYGVGNTYDTSPKPTPEIANPFLSGTKTSGVESRTAVMERFVFGSEHANLPIAERVQHLEKKLVPYEHHAGDQDLAVRVDHLWSMLSAANQQDKKEPGTD